MALLVQNSLQNFERFLSVQNVSYCTRKIQSLYSYVAGETCADEVDPCDPSPCGIRTCVRLTTAQIAANNNTDRFRCECLFGEIDIGGQCFCE